MFRKILFYSLLILSLLIVLLVWLDYRADFRSDNATVALQMSQITTDLPSDFKAFLPTPPSVVQSQFLSQIFTDEYYVYTCQAETDVYPTRVVALVARSIPTHGIGVPEAVEQALTQFETTIHQEWFSVIYPNKQYRTSEKSIDIRTIPIADDTVIADTLTLVSYADIEEKLVYGWVLNYLVTGSSEECVKEVMRVLYHIH